MKNIPLVLFIIMHKTVNEVFCIQDLPLSPRSYQYVNISKHFVAEINVIVQVFFVQTLQNFKQIQIMCRIGIESIWW